MEVRTAGMGGARSDRKNQPRHEGTNCKYHRGEQLACVSCLTPQLAATQSGTSSPPPPNLNGFMATIHCPSRTPLSRVVYRAVPEPLPRVKKPCPLGPRLPALPAFTLLPEPALCLPIVEKRADAFAPIADDVLADVAQVAAGPLTQRRPEEAAAGRKAGAGAGQGMQLRHRRSLRRLCLQARQAPPLPTEPHSPRRAKLRAHGARRVCAGRLT